MTKSAENAGAKQRGRPFKPGQSGNPAGKPKGTRNKATLMAQALLDGEAEALSRKCVELALGGDTTALRLCLERVCPPRRERPVALDMPVLAKAEDGPKAIGAIIAAVAGSEITPGEGQALTAMLEARRRAIETEELDQRITNLERRAGGR